jgi:Uma2 family endonuclease
MATAVHIPVSEYLKTSYEPDCDYVDGEVVERTLGEQWHGLVQSAVAAIFRANRRNWGLRAITEQRVQTSKTRFRVPDVTVVPSSDPLTAILTSAPVLCVEVLSPEDRFQRVVIRAQEYQRMGVPNIWIIDPQTREIWTMAAEGGPLPMLESDLTIPGSPVRMSVAEIFEEIDEAPKA